MVGFPLVALFIALILGLTVAQVGAISVAIEREARTAEVLLSMPISKTDIVAAKLVAVILIGLISILSFIVGSALYIYVALLYASRLIPPQPESVNIVEALSSAALNAITSSLIEARLAIAILLFTVALATINMALLGLIVGVLFAGDIRGATTSTGFLTVIVAVPAFFEMFIVGGQAPLWVKVLFHASPLYYPYMIMRGYAVGEPMVAAVYLAVEVLYLAAIMVLAAKLISSEAMIYGRQIIKTKLKLTR